MSPEEKRADVRGLDPWGLSQVERLLVGLTGVGSIRIVPDGHGGIDEVHVVSDGSVGPKQIVRNIESALLAEFGLQIDHRKISVAPLKEAQGPDIRADEPSPEPVEVPNADVAVEDAASRILLESLQIDRRAGKRVACRVVLRDDEETFEGEAEGPDFSQSRLEVAARALLDALNTATMEDISLRLEGIQRTDAFGKDLVLALVQGQERRRSVTLPGIGLVDDSAEEAAVLACLQATNRWAAAI